MKVYLLKDYVRVDGSTGEFVERGYAADFQKETVSISLAGGRNQFVSFQIVSEMERGGHEAFALELSDLSGPSAADLSNRHYGAFLEWFHESDSRRIPDALIPMERRAGGFGVPEGFPFGEQPPILAVWVDLFIPEEAVPGSYAGALKLRQNGIVSDFEIRVDVFDVSSPERSRMTADFNGYTDWLSPVFPELAGNENRFSDGSFFKLEHRFYRMARDHRCQLETLPYRQSGAVTPSYAPELEGEGKNIRVKSWELFDRHFGPMLDGTLFEGSAGGSHPIEYMYLPFNLGWPASFAKWGKKGYKTEYRRILREFIRHFEEKGWTKTAFEIYLNHKKMYHYFPYTIDEIWYDHDEEALDAFYEVLGDSLKDSNVKIELRIDTSNHYGNHYAGRHSDWHKLWYVNSNIFSWFPESVPLLKQKGCKIWLYGGVLQELPESLLSLFVWPVRCFMTGADGFSLWNSVEFDGDPFRTPEQNGAQTIMYPGGKFGISGPLPSIRLKAFRNAMQLGDLLASANGTETETSGGSLIRRMKAIVSRHFGFDESGWWRDKPDFVNESPRDWDFEKKFNEASPVPFHLNRSPALIERLTRDVLELLEPVRAPGR